MLYSYVEKWLIHYLLCSISFSHFKLDWIKNTVKLKLARYQQNPIYAKNGARLKFLLYWTQLEVTCSYLRWFALLLFCVILLSRSWWNLLSSNFCRKDVWISCIKFIHLIQKTDISMKYHIMRTVEGCKVKNIKFGPRWMTYFFIIMTYPTNFLRLNMKKGHSFLFWLMTQNHNRWLQF